MTLERVNMNFLNEWLGSEYRKPLIIRGARQVGKTWMIREFAKRAERELTEINFERQPELKALFQSNDPNEIVTLLRAIYNQPIDHASSLLFLDEIQAAPEILAKLRWFAGGLCELPIVCAGSLLEFMLEQPSFSMPVGRISYMYLEPLSFEEFLLASNREQLCVYLQNYPLQHAMPETLHRQLMELFREYIVIGGMPAIVQNWVNEHSLARVSQISHDLMAIYRDDFGKYRNRLATEKLDEVLAAIPLQLGQKFVYSRVSKEANSQSLKQALKLLNKARVAHQIICTSANGAPLAAQVNAKNFKEILLDVGLCATALGLDLSQIKSMQEISFINKGGIAEQVVGQLLRTTYPPFIEPNLYYWRKETKGSEAEIDYIIQHSSRVIPIEVKAGSTGSLKSLHLFMSVKNLSLAIRINSDFPSVVTVNVKNHQGKQIVYKLLSLPFYLVGQIPRLVDSL
jgi:uncharacterized protein